MGLFVGIVVLIPVAIAIRVGWQCALGFWTVLFAGSGLLKLLGLGF
jgi:hypothetical protein